MVDMMSANESEGGYVGIFFAIILGAAVLLFGVLVILPGVDRWQAGNEQIASIEAAKAAQIAQLQAERDLAVAKVQAQRDVQLAEQAAQAQVQTAAIELAGRAAESANGTLRIFIMGIFAFVFLVTGGGVLALTLRNWERI